MHDCLGVNIYFSIRLTGPISQGSVGQGTEEAVMATPDV